MPKYHPVLVTLHWIMALMILIALIVGGMVLEDMAPDDPDTLLILAGHMSAGIVIGLLLIARLVTRLRTPLPPRATTGHAFLDRISLWTHWGFYVLVAGMVLSGLATALGAGLFPIVFAGTADALPEELSDLLQYEIHEIIATALSALIALHIAAAIYHQVVLKDGLLRRMWFGQRG